MTLTRSAWRIVGILALILLTALMLSRWLNAPSAPVVRSTAPPIPQQRPVEIPPTIEVVPTDPTVPVTGGQSAGMASDAASAVARAAARAERGSDP
jgi:hypothetical protein